MKRAMWMPLAVLVFLGGVGRATADPILFYSGNFDAGNANANGLANENDAIVGGSPYGASSYQNFIVPTGQTWHVTGLFSNNLMGLNPGTAFWSIRTGVSEGNGGTLIASGTSTATVTPTGRSGFGFTEFNVAVNGLSITLGPGTYWMDVVPIDPSNANRSFNSNTFGSGSIGTDIADQAFWDSSFFGANFTNADTQGVFPAFSAGVLGATIVPEPATLAVFGALAVGAFGVRRRVKTSKTA